MNSPVITAPLLAHRAQSRKQPAPASTHQSEAGRALNRRVELMLRIRS